MSIFAFLLVLTAACTHASWNVLAKHAAHCRFFNWYYSVGASVLFAPLAWWVSRDFLPTASTAVIVALVATSVLHALYSECLQRGYRAADLSIVYPVARGTGPLVSFVGAIFVLGETPSLVATAGAVLVVCGVLVLAGGRRLWLQRRGPRGARGTIVAGLYWGGLTGLLIAAYTLNDGYAVKVLLVPPILVDYVGNCFRAVVLAPQALRRRDVVAAEYPRYWRQALGVSILGPTGYILVLYAMTLAPVSHVAPAREMSMLVGAWLGARLLGEGTHARTRARRGTHRRGRRGARARLTSPKPRDVARPLVVPRATVAYHRPLPPMTLSMTNVRAALVAVALAAAALPAVARDWSTIRIGVDATYKPFTFKTADGRLSGFDVDIARALCAEMKAKCSFVESSWEGIIPGLRANKFDAIVSSMSITDERRKAVDFTDKYYQTPTAVIAKNGSGIDGSRASLKGKRVGVLKASIQETYAKGELEGASVVSYDSTQQSYVDLKSGRLDAVVVDKFEGRGGFVDTPDGKGYAFVGPDLTEPKYFGTGAGIAIRKSDTDLRDRLNAALKTIRANGTWKKLADQYFDFDIYGK